ncbi:MAG: ATP-binding protein [Clostridiales bacterium]|nr:ATP-binding protein [Clostridiales bacterium]
MVQDDTSNQASPSGSRPDLEAEIDRLRKENQILTHELDMAVRLLRQDKDDPSNKVALDDFSSLKTRQEKYMDLLLENCNDIILLLDPEHKLIFSTSAQIADASHVDRIMIDGLLLRDCFIHVMEYRESMIMEGAVDFSDGMAPRHFSIDVSPLISSDGRLEGVMAFFHDVTEILAAKAQAEQASQVKSDFIASVSHEIRTPMNAIIGIANMLKRTELNEIQRQYLLNIQNSSHSLLGLINDILDFSKIEAGKLELVSDFFDFRQLLLQHQSIFEILCWQKNLQMICDFDENLPKVIYGDEVRLGEILSNLLNNAVKYTALGFIRFSVFSSQEGVFTFAVQDTGIGIREDALPRLFNAFEQLDPIRNKNVVGTGLGLTITRHLCEIMGGAITVTSQYGRGSRFVAEIPLTIGRDEDLRDDQQAVRPFKAPSAKVLLVDDIEINLLVAAAIMELYGIHSDQASSGQEALDLVHNNHYHMIFMDHMMPNMDGIETTEQIRMIGGWAASVPIIALTANVVQGATEMFVENGMNDFLPKPIDANEIAACILRWLPQNLIRYEGEPIESW